MLGTQDDAAWGYETLKASPPTEALGKRWSTSVAKTEVLKFKIWAFSRTAMFVGTK